MSPNVNLYKSKKVKVGSYQEIAQSERNSHFINRGRKTLNLQILLRRKHKIVKRMGSYLTPRHESDICTIKTTTEASPWNDQ